MLYPVNIASTPVKEMSQIAVARQRSVRLARQLGFDEATRGKVALVVSEAATNILVHAQRGEILMTASEHRGCRCIHILATDRGPGIIKLGQALAGGRSTRRGLGEGLGAMQRLSNRFEIYAPPGGGTTIFCCLCADSEEFIQAWKGLEINAAMRPKRGEKVCGDTWAYRPLSGDSGLLLVVDGIGHGYAAQEAAHRARDTLAGFRKPDPTALMNALHDNLSGTRGAAALAVFVDPSTSSLRACGVGNISASVDLAGESRGLVSHNGTLGSGRIRLQEFSYPWLEGALLLLHSDGLSPRWDLKDYPGLRLRHPALVSAVLYRDHAKDRDDATVVVLRRARQQGT